MTDQDDCKVRLARHKSFADGQALTTVSGVTTSMDDFAILLNDR
jgi:hypothetical protein